MRWLWGVLFTVQAFAVEVPIDTTFPLENYPQDLSLYLSPKDQDYTLPLIDKKQQTKNLEQFYRHYYGIYSPWSESMVNAVLPFVQSKEEAMLAEFSNQGKAESQLHFAFNFALQEEEELQKIKENMQLHVLQAERYQVKRRAIAVANTFARALPKESPDFYRFTLPGQGFPFDNLQESAIFAGTPLYVLAVSKDKAWSLVWTPDGYFAWVKSRDFAYVSPAFVQEWKAFAKKGMVAIVKTHTSILDAQQHFYFTTYLGAVFPKGRGQAMLIPRKDAHHHANIEQGFAQKEHAFVTMPLTANKKHFAEVIQQLLNRPYGWGGAFFYNDCSQEMKSVFTPFGIWLPRNSLQQIQATRFQDLSPKSLQERVSTLEKEGHPLLTLVYLKGHIMLYIGMHKGVPIVYQNLWGLSPADKSMRYVLGRSVLLPLLATYPENTHILSQAQGALFQIGNVQDRMDEEKTIPERVQQWFFPER